MIYWTMSIWKFSTSDLVADDMFDVYEDGDEVLLKVGADDGGFVVVIVFVFDGNGALVCNQSTQGKLG